MEPFIQRRIDTPLGPMVGVSDSRALRALFFEDHFKFSFPTILGHAPPLDSIEEELFAYFQGTLTTFKTPLSPLGTPFQQSVWQALQTIPFGKTAAYSEIALLLNKPSAFRAVALANGANPIPIAIPCHRIINKDRKLGGYSCGLERKIWLLNHEKR